MAVGLVNKIIGIIYIIAGLLLTLLGVILVQLAWQFIPVIESFTSYTVPTTYFYAFAAVLILPWIFFIIHGVAHYLIGRQIE